MSSEQAVRILRAKADWWEKQVRYEDIQGVDDLRELAADISLIASLVADHIERSIRVEEAVVALNQEWGKRSSEEWEEERVQVRPPTTEVVSFRLRSEELDRLQDAAGQRKVTLSQFIQKAIEQAMEDES